MLFKFLMNFMKAKKLLPKISDTEREALEAGTVWIEGDFFAGTPDFKKILEEPYHGLSIEEQAFLNGPAEELCQMMDSYKIAKTKRIPESITRFIKDKGFMGLLIPKKYGGLEFSSLAISTVIHKVMPRSAIVGVLLIIPNSLGAAELLIHYGTEEQKKAYLPKLATGHYIPCFALTETLAGSDAASMRSEGVVFKDGDGSLKIRMNFEKRYISLAPVSNLISVACKLRDPDNLLGKGLEPGITVMIVHKETNGVKIGEHHEPIGDSFYNGPIYGKDVIVEVDQIIGGADYAGKGWKMLMEQLGGGRAISLPAGAVGAMKNVLAATSAYAEVRSQFNISIGKMEGIIEKIAKMAGLTYAFDAMRIFSCSAVDRGEQPPVVSAVLKAYSTDQARAMLIDAMDIFSGSGVMQGPKNILGRGFAASPIGITVEGANIMTRTLIIFGQGATRCHPFAYHLIKAVEENHVAEFRNNLLSWLASFFIGTLTKSIRTLTRGYSSGTPVSGLTAKYYRRISWSASRFAMLTNLAIFTLGGKLKAKGSLTGRFADALAWQLIATSALRRFEEEGRRKQDEPLVAYACEYALYEVQKAFEGIYRNFNVPFFGLWMKTIGSWILRLNPVGYLPNDKLAAESAKTVEEFHDQFNHLTSGIFLPPAKEEGFGQLLHAFKLLHKTQKISQKIVQAQKNKKLPRGIPDQLVDEALKVGCINEDEARQLTQVSAAKKLAIEVDSFTPAQFFSDESLKIAPGFEEKVDQYQSI